MKWRITRCPGCGRMVGVNGSTCTPVPPAGPAKAGAGARLLGRASRAVPATSPGPSEGSRVRG